MEERGGRGARKEEKKGKKRKKKRREKWLTMAFFFPFSLTFKESINVTLLEPGYMADFFNWLHVLAPPSSFLMTQKLLPIFLAFVNV